MGRLSLGVLMAASLAALMAGNAQPSGPPLANQSYTYRILNNPTTGDGFGLRAVLQQTAQANSNKLYATLSSLLGGSAPPLNDVPTGSPFLTDGDASANIADQVGAPKGSVNVSPLALEALINNSSPYHDGGVHLLPHEYAHLHQTSTVLADPTMREGGAEEFSNEVTPTAAQRAGIPFHGAFNSVYGPQATQAQQRGRQWVLGSQFGNTAPVRWP